MLKLYSEKKIDITKDGSFTLLVHAFLSLAEELIEQKEEFEPDNKQKEGVSMPVSTSCNTQGK